MRKTAILILALLLISITASAQMRNHPPMNPGNPGAGPRFGLMPGDMGPMHLAVIDNGTVAVIDRETPAANATSTWPSDTLVAYNASGVKAWTLKLDGMAMGLTAAANQYYLIVVKESSRALVAVNAAGVVAWSIPLD